MMKRTGEQGDRGPKMAGDSLQLLPFPHAVFRNATAQTGLETPEDRQLQFPACIRAGARTICAAVYRVLFKESQHAAA